MERRAFCSSAWAGTRNSGPDPRRTRRTNMAVALAMATGMKLRGFHSKRSSSMARRTAAMGEAKVADIPAAAPATRRLFLSAAVRRKHWAMIDPKAPPVMMMGPSEPKGPPEPIEMAADTGLRIATLGSTRLPRIKIASRASGMPCPRMRSDPKRARTPMISAPRTGTATIHRPRAESAGRITPSWP